MAQQASVNSLFNFETMLMPKIITLIYWALLIVVLAGSIGLIIGGNIFMGMLLLVVGGVVVRLWCEFFIVVFKINENIQKIADKSDNATTHIREFQSLV